MGKFPYLQQQKKLKTNKQTNKTVQCRRARIILKSVKKKKNNDKNLNQTNIFVLNTQYKSVSYVFKISNVIIIQIIIIVISKC